MKTQFLSLIALLFLFGSCSSSNSEATPANSYYVKVKIDGTAYEASGINVYAINTTDTYNIYATFDTKRTMYIQLDKAKGIGTHTANENPNFIFFRDETETINRSDRIGGTGEVQITEKTADVVKGKFKCTVKNANNSTKIYTFTEGDFVVKFNK